MIQISLVLEKLLFFLKYNKYLEFIFQIKNNSLEEKKNIYS